MEDIFFPMADREKNLPFYITCIGETDRQHEINRPKGYYCPQILICSEGGGVLRTDDGEKNIRAGSAIYIPKGAPHAYSPIEKLWRMHYVSFSGYSAELFLRQLGFQNIGVYTVEVGVMKSIFRRMMNALKSDRFYGGYTASAIVYEYIVEFNRQVSGMGSKFASESASLTPVLNYIDEHFSEDIDLDTLCGLIQVTPQYLCRLFKKRLGIRPLEYIAQRRIQEAKIFLAEGTLSIQEIALKVGYRDAGYFSSVFKRNEGISPREYTRREI